MKRITLLVIMICVLAIANAGTVYVQKNGTADVKVWIADYKSEADLCVYVAKYKSETNNKDEIWFFEKYKSSAGHTIKMVESKSSADLKVFYVKYKSEAGWKNKSHELRGRLK